MAGNSVEVWVGPARSGKTTAALQAYRNALRRATVGGCLWIAPTERAAAGIRGELVGRDLAACFRPGVLTFDRLAEAILADAPEPAQRLSRLAKRELLRGLLDELAREGVLEYFGPIAQTAGFVELIDDWIRELKRLEIWPQDLKQAGGRRPLAKDRELLEIYARYQDLLTSRQLYDAEGRFWSARARLRDAAPPRWRQLGLIVVDGFSDFTRTQHEVLELLADRAEGLVVTLVDEPGNDRPDVFAKTRATNRQLLARHSGARIRWFARRGVGEPGLDHLERQLFRDPRVLEPAAASPAVEFLEAPGPAREIELVGRRIKELLYRGDPASGGVVSPAEVVVVSRQLSEHAPHLRATLASLGVPCEIDEGQPLAEVPLVRAVANVVKWQSTDWPYEALLALLANNYFAPTWPAWRPLEVRLACEQVVRRLQVPEGLAVLVEATDRARLATWEPSPGDARGDEDSRELTAAQQLAEYARAAFPVWQELAALFASWPAAAPADVWAEVLRETAHALGWLRAIDAGASPEARDRDRAGWERLLAALGELAELDGWLGRPTRDWTQRELAELLADLGRAEELRPSPGRPGVVRVLSANSVRAFSAPYVFVMGLTESSFPRSDAQDRLYNETELARLAGEGLPFVLRQERLSEELLLFYEVVTRATRRLVLSYPAVDERAEPLLASSFVRDLAQIFPTETRPAPLELSPLPLPEALWSPADFRLAAVDAALHGEPELLAGWAGFEPAALVPKGGAAAIETAAALRIVSTAGVGTHLLDVLEMTGSRFGERTFGPYDGIVESPAALDWLAGLFGPSHPWSASQLETYEDCPFKFFGEHLLHLAPLPDPRLKTDHAERGSLLHRALAAAHRQLRAAGTEATAARDEFWAIAEATLEAALTEAGESPLAAALSRISRRRLRELLDRYWGQLLEHAERTGPLGLRPAYFEVSFGLELRAESAPSTAEPLILRSAGDEFRITGRIDRIDLAEDGERRLAAVIDYKSGRRPALSSQARLLQLPLYRLAVERVLLADERAVVVELGYWYLKDKGFETLPLDEADPAAADPRPADSSALDTRVAGLVRNIRGGMFPVDNPDEHCTERCEFRHVCRIQQLRGLNKQWPPLPHA